jgi:hypothetical protein
MNKTNILYNKVRTIFKLKVEEAVLEVEIPQRSHLFIAILKTIYSPSIETQFRSLRS